MKQNLIAGIVIIVLVTGFAVFNILTQKQPVEYYKTTGIKEYGNVLIDNNKTLKKVVKDYSLKTSMTNSKTFEKKEILDYFNEDYFENKKLAIVTLYEDNSKEYIYSIDSLKYNEDKTEATITYTYKVGTFADTFATTWYNYLFVELEKTVTNVNFVLDNNNQK